MNDYIDEDFINKLMMLLALAAALIVFWILETVWRNEKRGLVLVAMFPPAILYFIIKYWEETRAKCFFAALFVVMLVLISAVTHYDFGMRILALFKIVSIWPYYAFLHFNEVLNT